MSAITVKFDRVIKENGVLYAQVIGTDGRPRVFAESELEYLVHRGFVTDRAEWARALGELRAEMAGERLHD